MSFRYLFAPFGLLVYVFYAIAWLVLPFAFFYSIVGPVGASVGLILLIFSGGIAIIQMKLDDSTNEDAREEVVYSNGSPQGVDASKVELDSE